MLLLYIVHVIKLASAIMYQKSIGNKLYAKWSSVRHSTIHLLYIRVFFIIDDGRTIQVEVGFCSRRSRENYYPVTRTIGLHYKTVTKGVSSVPPKPDFVPHCTNAFFS